MCEPSTIQGEPTLIAEDRFASPPDERLFGSGQFQDGYLDVRDFPAPAHASQHANCHPVPLLQQGLRPALAQLRPDRSQPRRSTDRADARAVGETRPTQVDDLDGRHPQRPAHSRPFLRQVYESQQAGRHAMMLDVGQAMARRYHVEIDGNGRSTREPLAPADHELAYGPRGRASTGET